MAEPHYTEIGKISQSGLIPVQTSVHSFWYVFSYKTDVSNINPFELFIKSTSSKRVICYRNFCYCTGYAQDLPPKPVQCKPPPLSRLERSH